MPKPIPVPTWVNEDSPKIVVAIDVHSSSGMVGELQATGQIEKFAAIIKEIDACLWQEESCDVNGGSFCGGQTWMHPYNFVGDGWISFFHADTPIPELVKFLHNVSLRFSSRCESILRQSLTGSAHRFGLRFGADLGRIYHFTLRGSDEYIGDPIVAASRLQERGKSHESISADPLIISLRCFKNFDATKPELERFLPEQKSFPINPSENLDSVLLSLPSNREDLLVAREAQK